MCPQDGVPPDPSEPSVRTGQSQVEEAVPGISWTGPSSMYQGLKMQLPDYQNKRQCYCGKIKIRYRRVELKILKKVPYYTHFQWPHFNFLEEQPCIIIIIIYLKKNNPNLQICQVGLNLQHRNLCPSN